MSDNNYDQCSTYLSLTDLPMEIFLHICSFLDANTLIRNLGLVCKQFYNILKDDSLWKVRINRIWPNACYPVLSPVDENEQFWKLSCLNVERQAFLWSNLDPMDKFALTGGHYGTIDGLLLMNNGKICISGGRDRLLICWQLNATRTIENQQNANIACGFGHTGWIWDITCLGDNTIYSCSWDRTVRAWDLSNNFSSIRTFKMSSHGALLCVAACNERNLVATGSFRRISVFDPRAHDSSVTKFKPHQLAVMKVAINSDYIISASEDKTVAIWDQRMRRTIKTVTISKDSYPMSMFVNNDAIYTGDSNAMIHIININNNFEQIKSYKSDHTKGITGIHSTLGCLITTSLDGTVKISSPTDPPISFATLNCKHGDIASMHYLNETLAVSGSDEIDIWRPKTEN
ncbi:hypothetical protein HCN44_000624 [Aphidius gifuensis]|uniref:F-box domain-containing protein n=1 Tax=Aphidius gifuensis TaxID=684658 RepID=A0A834XT73_APHGI|nr:F-box/WD repeat-containing protein 9-like [Aphidius gifuensis]KAF7990819.1 hypothetical protein HCN44_000624 [Aphidius gifuensis]